MAKPHSAWLSVYLQEQELEWGWELFFLCSVFPSLHLKILFSPLSFQPATSLAVQIHVHPPNIKGLLVECNSRGWFPQPQMEWRDSRGGVIPATSESHSQDVDKLFHMKMTLFLTQSSSKNITCYLRNPVTGQEERTSIALSGEVCVSVLQKMTIVVKFKN